MKRITTIIIAAAALAALLTGCGKSEAERVADIYAFFGQDTTIADSYEKINRVCPDRPAGLSGSNDIIDYFTMMASRCKGKSDINFFDMGPGKGRDILLEIPGKEKDRVTLVAAAADTWRDSLTTKNDDLGCIAAFEVFNAFKSLKIKPRNTIRILLYQDVAGSHAGLRPYLEYSRSKDEEHLMQLFLTSDPEGPRKTFTVGEPTSIYRTFTKVIPPFFEGYGNYTFDRGEQRFEAWELKAPFYTYNIDRNDAANDIAAVVSLVMLMD